MKKTISPQPPQVDDFTFIYNDHEAHVSKYQFALYSMKFRRIPEFYVTNSLEIRDKPSFEVFCQFLRAAQGIEINITVDNALDILHFCEIWEVETVANEVKKLMNSTAELNKAIQKIVNSKKKDSFSNLEDIISNNIDSALQINSLTKLPIQTLIRIVNNPKCVIKKPHKYYQFVKQMLNKVGSEASLLASKVDISHLSSDEALEFVQHPNLIKSFLADSLAETVVLLLQENSKFIKQVFDSQTQLKQLAERLDSLEHSAAFDQTNNSDVLKQLNKKISALEAKVTSKGIDGQNPNEVSEKINAALAKMETITSDAKIQMNQKYEEVEQKAHKDLRKTNKIVNNLTKKSSVFETSLTSLKADNKEIQNSMTTILRKILESEEAITKGGIESSSGGLPVPPKQLVAQFNGQPFYGIFGKLREMSKDDVYLKSQVKITASTCDKNEPFQIVDSHWNDLFFTEDKVNSWIMFDFKNKRVNITNYTLKTHKYASGTCHIKAWIIEGSNGHNQWTEIDRRFTPMLNGPNKSQTFPATNTNDMFQFIRLRQIGLNCRNDNILAITNVELFGTIYYFS